MSYKSKKNVYLKRHLGASFLRLNGLKQGVLGLTGCQINPIMSIFTSKEFLIKNSDDKIWSKKMSMKFSQHCSWSWQSQDFFYRLTSHHLIFWTLKRSLSWKYVFFQNWSLIMKYILYSPMYRCSFNKCDPHYSAASTVNSLNCPLECNF